MSEDGAVERVAHRMGIAWPSAEEGRLRAGADAFEVLAGVLDEQRQCCTTTVRSVAAGNRGGGVEQFGSFWSRFDAPGPRGGVLPVTAVACRAVASVLREFADAVARTKDLIRAQVAIAGAALVFGAVAAVWTLGASEVAAEAVAVAIADVAAQAGVALSATVTAVVSTAAVATAAGALESVAMDALWVQPMSIAFGGQRGLTAAGLVHAAEFGAAGGALGGAAGGGLSRLPALARATELSAPRLSASLEDLTRFTAPRSGRMVGNAALGVGVSEVLSGGDASGFDVLSAGLGGLVAPSGRRRTVGVGTGRTGHWKGDELTLNPADNEVATRAYATALGREPRITADLHAIVRELPDGQLAGLKTRLKGPDSYRRKIATGMAGNGTPREAPERVRDVIRYTVVLSCDDYAVGVTVSCRALLDRGYHPVPGRFTNSWGRPDYRGVNSSWRDHRSGQVFEVQFHTADGLAARQGTHHWYEEERLPSTSPSRKAELAQLQRDDFSQVPVPRDVLSIPHPSVADAR